MKNKGAKATPRPAVYSREGPGNIHAKLTSHEIDLIRPYYAIGISVKVLAAKIEISAQQVRNIAKARSRRIF